MAYVAVKGGEKAIAAAHKLLAEARRGNTSVPEIGVAQIREQLGLAVDRVMAEGSCYDPDLAALALKQAWGDVGEAIFMLRAYRTTLPRFGTSEPVDTTAMAVRRRVSAAYKDIPGGQILGPTFDYTHRMLDFGLVEDGSPVDEAEIAEAPVEKVVQTIADVMAYEGILQDELARADALQPYDLTRDPPNYPAGRDQRLQALARGDEGFLLSLGYSAMRSWGGEHPLCGEIRMGEVEVMVEAPEFGFPVAIADITLTECQMIGNVADDGINAPYLTRGYGLTLGRSERKAMAMAIVDRSMTSVQQSGKQPYGASDEEFVLAHADHVEASGFVLHLKLPHYVDFQAGLQNLREMRTDFFRRAQQAEQAGAEDEVAPLAEAAE
jgi:alpha-D-ribose 1-methylphosphonate 5-triphosphate synthase subunit PhnI